MTRTEIIARRRRARRVQWICKAAVYIGQSIAITAVMFGVFGLGELLCVLAGVR